MTVPAPAPLNSDHAAARTVGLWKVYGEGDTQVVALSDVSVAFARGRYTAEEVAGGAYERWFELGTSIYLGTRATAAAPGGTSPSSS